MTTVTLIYAEKCRDCKRMQRFLEKAINETGKEVKIVAVNSDTDEAIDIAINKGIEDIPGCVIGENVFFGKKGFSYNGILKAIEELN
jgi:thioredoxin-like negative regulator of GroEL